MRSPASLPFAGRRGGLRLACCLLAGHALAAPVLGQSLVLERTGPVSEPVALAPAPDSPISEIARDCGSSARLSDCRTLHAFCDSYQFDGDAWFFLANTAALSEPDAPTVLVEPLNASPRPMSFIPTAPLELDCPDGWREVAWPHSVVAVPLPDGRDRVLTWFSTSCRDDGAGLSEGHGVGVGEWIHDPDELPSATNPIQVTVLSPDVFPSGSPPYTAGAILIDDFIQLHRCPRGGRCRVARVPVGSEADSSAYRYWDGSGWSTDESAAVPLDMPGTNPSSLPDVTRVDALDAWVMAYMVPWSVARVLLRVAADPLGPWSEPVELLVPDCSRCYHPRVHDSLSSSRTIGLSIYDPGFTPDHGSQKAFEVPVDVSPDARSSFLRPDPAARDGARASFRIESSGVEPESWIVLRGTLPAGGTLATRAGPHDAACHAVVSEPSFIDDEPAADGGWYYLVVGAGDCGEALGGTGDDSLGRRRPVPDCR